MGRPLVDGRKMCEGFNSKGYRCQMQAEAGTTRCKFHPLGDETVEVKRLAAEEKRGRRRQVREALREAAEREADGIVGAYMDARHAVNSDGDPDHRVRLVAVEGLLAQVYGKPVQPTEERGAVSFTIVRTAKQSVEEMRAEDTGDPLPLQ